jgi:hypothetical protein
MFSFYRRYNRSQYIVTLTLRGWLLAPEQPGVHTPVTSYLWKGHKEGRSYYLPFIYREFYFFTRALSEWVVIRLCQVSRTHDALSSLLPAISLYYRSTCFKRLDENMIRRENSSGQNISGSCWISGFVPDESWHPVAVNFILGLPTTFDIIYINANIKNYIVISPLMHNMELSQGVSRDCNALPLTSA